MQDNPLARSIPHLITRIFREQNRIHGRAVAEFNLSTEQAHLLVVLWTMGPMTMKDLGKEVALSSGTLSTAIDRMESSGLVTRSPDPTDGRSVRIEPATWPKPKRDKLLTTIIETETTLFSVLTEKERTTLYDLLNRVLTNLEPTNQRPKKSK
jgi:DNA-binding MarR family transcriptional regulator